MKEIKNSIRSISVDVNHTLDIPEDIECQCFADKK
jgi:hypothetical protein